MKIYLAGNMGNGIAEIERERVLIKLKADRLFSFYYHSIEGEFSDEFEYRINKIKDENILCGSRSFRNSGKD
ncbi:hypothetical protein LCGC14_1118090 [marine sediment metagenome]|uniref:Uncharacterized protein n=1 Tax=marine sediment metagenome TaxID=412755 RepID=A0A0F9MSP4_9ZZZZ